MKRIQITRDPTGKVVFDTVSIDATENVFFTNMDPAAAHFPSIASNQLGKAPSPNSSQCTVDPPPGDETSYVFTYKCKLHADEQGTIYVYLPLAAADETTLPDATVGQPIATPPPVIVGGRPPYTITDQLYQVLDANQNVLQSGSGGIGPGLELYTDPDPKVSEITVIGTPTAVGTYIFTFTVNDHMGRNCQQIQYTMVVNPKGT